jgi:hypothetical protein
MRGYDRSRDWLKCDGCEHLFTRMRVLEFSQDKRAIS